LRFDRTDNVLFASKQEKRARTVKSKIPRMKSGPYGI